MYMVNVNMVFKVITKEISQPWGLNNQGLGLLSSVKDWSHRALHFTLIKDDPILALV